MPLNVDETHRTLLKEVQRGLIGFPVNYDDEIEERDLATEYGLCNSCKNFRLVKTKYKTICAECGYTDIHRLSQEDPVITCTMYEKRGAMTLDQMVAIATVIEIDKKKVGF